MHAMIVCIRPVLDGLGFTTIVGVIREPLGPTRCWREGHDYQVRNRSLETCFMLQSCGALLASPIGAILCVDISVCTAAENACFPWRHLVFTFGSEQLKAGLLIKNTHRRCIDEFEKYDF
jgi:hypothetical protein